MSRGTRPWPVEIYGIHILELRQIAHLLWSRFGESYSLSSRFIYIVSFVIIEIVSPILELIESLLVEFRAFMRVWTNQVTDLLIAVQMMSLLINE